MWEGFDCVEEGKTKVTFSLVAPDNSDPTFRHNGCVGEVNEGTSSINYSSICVQQNATETRSEFECQKK